jgi:hypothetical protein
MLWIGTIAFVFSIDTILFYYPILSIEIVLTIGGILLFATTYFAIKDLKTRKLGHIQTVLQKKCFFWMPRY